MFTQDKRTLKTGFKLFQRTLPPFKLALQLRCPRGSDGRGSFWATRIECRWWFDSPTGPRISLKWWPAEFFFPSDAFMAFARSFHKFLLSSKKLIVRSMPSRHIGQVVTRRKAMDAGKKKNKLALQLRSHYLQNAHLFFLWFGQCRSVAWF